MMVPGRIAASYLALILAACAGRQDQISSLPAVEGPLECVPYARAVSGIELSGDAWSWWRAAEGRYQRGTEPALGAVLVFSRTNRLPRGHVAVVTAVEGPREIRIAHANWIPGRVTEDVSIIDVSAANNWSAVRVFSVDRGGYGATYRTDGFIYRAPAVAGAPTVGARIAA
ncbi:MAG: CHAP domain-containing protein [Alphaproteobacteria bacterium]